MFYNIFHKNILYPILAFVKIDCLRQLNAKVGKGNLYLNSVSNHDLFGEA